MTKFVFVWGNIQSLVTVENNVLRLLETHPFMGKRKFQMVEFVDKRNIRTFYSDETVLQQNRMGERFLEPAFFEKFLADSNAARTRAWAFFKELYAKPFATASNAQLSEWFTSYNRHWRDVINYFECSQSEWTQAVERQLEKGLNAHLPPQDVQPALLALSTSAELDVINQEAIEWQALVRSKTALSDADIVGHAERYPWLFAVHYSMEVVFNLARARFEKDKARSDFMDVAGEKRKLYEKQADWLSRIADDTVRYCANVIQQLAVDRARLKATYAGSDFFALGLFTEIAKRVGVSMDVLMFDYGIDGILNALSGTRLSEKEIQEREVASVYFVDGDHVVKAYGEQGLAQAHVLLADYFNSLKATEVRGQCASQGAIRARVRLVHSNDVASLAHGVHSFTKGDILLTQMTQPNMTVLIEKAAGIITDEGGMASHAAIMAREFNIPCLVGTHVATKVFKDGDVVELDATNGVARKVP